MLFWASTERMSVNLSSIAACLGTPPRQPKYRNGRPHGDFVGNLTCSRDSLIRGLQTAFDAHTPLPDAPWDIAAALVDAKYKQAHWNEQL